MATSTFTQLLSSEFKFNVALRPQRPYRLLGTATSTFTQLLGSEFKLNVALGPQRPYGLSGTGSPGRPPRLSHSFRALSSS